MPSFAPPHDVSQNKLLNKPVSCRWFETPKRSYCVMVLHAIGSEWVMRFNGLFPTTDIGVHVVHINRVIITYNWNHYHPSHREHLISRLQSITHGIKWRHSCDTSMWIAISSPLDIGFIHCQVCQRWYDMLDLRPLCAIWFQRSNLEVAFTITPGIHA